MSSTLASFVQPLGQKCIRVRCPFLVVGNLHSVQHLLNLSNKHTSKYTHCGCDQQADTGKHVLSNDTGKHVLSNDTGKHVLSNDTGKHVLSNGHPEDDLLKKHWAAYDKCFCFRE